MSAATSRTFALDLAERVASTFVVAAAGVTAPVLVAVNNGDLVSFIWWKQVAIIAVVAGLSAVGTLIKGLIAGQVTGTAGLSEKVALSTPPAPVPAHDDDAFNAAVAALAEQDAPPAPAEPAAPADPEPAADLAPGELPTVMGG